MDNLMITSILSMTGLSVLFAGILGFADKKLKVEDDPKVKEINSLLPGVNCGACGCLSCHDFAEHIVSEGTEPSKCKVISEENLKKICALSGSDLKGATPTIALVRCSAKGENKKPKAEYEGVKTCTGANLVFGGGMECQYGCIGFGDCVNVCPFDAIKIEGSLAVVDIEKCTGCGKCVSECPRKIIVLEDKEKETNLFYVACSSFDGPLRVRQICGVGCIGCGICQKLSTEGFFTVENNLSIADYKKQKDSGKVREIAIKCPTKVIKEL